MRISLLSFAVQSALAAMFVAPMAAQADDAALEALADEVAAIRRPTNYVEVGLQNVSEDSAKFGEYNGLDDSGINVIGNFSVRGGNAYEGGDGTLRWGIFGSDLGTSSRELGASVGNQGHWDLSLGYDELRHNITDTYQTPQQGNMGGNTFTLPGDFGAFIAATAPSARTLNDTQLGAFHTEDVGTTRKNTSFAAGYQISPQLKVQFDYNHLDQSGAKLIGAGALGGVAPAGGTGTWRAEAVAILMNPTNYETDSFNLALNWVGEKGHLSGSYVGSFFKDGYDRLTYENPMLSSASTAPAGVYQTTTMSTAPDNKLHQLNLSGGYAFTPATKLAGGLSYGRNTQDDRFLTGMPETVSSPRASLDGRVITTHADLKLTNQTTKVLTLSAAVKYNERDNESVSAIYQYYALNNRTTADYAANAPYSNRKTELELAGDYRLDKNQTLRLAYNYEKIKRWCDDYALDANCLISTSNTENKLGLKYKLKAGDGVNVHAGYTYADRDGKFDHNAVTPLAGLDTATPDDVNSQNYPGFIAYIYAPRKQDQLKAGVNWQASEKLDLSAEGRYAKDDYDASLGVQDSRTTGINLDATYSYSEDASVSAYVSWQQSKRDMRIGATGAGADNTATSYAGLVAPTNIWTNQLDENGRTFGVSTKHRLMGGKLELIGDLSYSLDKSGYSTRVPYLSTCGNDTVLSCGDLPDIKSELLSLKITGIYALNKQSKVSVAYLYQELDSNDYFYNTYQYGYTGLRVMPTNQAAPNYSVHVVGLSYIYNFK